MYKNWYNSKHKAFTKHAKKATSDEGKKDKEQKKNEANLSAAARQLGPKSFAAKQAAGPKVGAAKQLGAKAGDAKGALPPMRKFEGPSAFAVLKRLQDALAK